MQFQACAYCNHPNPVGTNYCNDCGAALHLKPCRHCGAVAVAKASHCPACKAPFPTRPTIEVDIPWAVPGDPRASPAPALPTAPVTLAGPSDDEDLDTASPAFVATRRLIEKASERASESAGDKALVLPPPGHGPAGRAPGSFRPAPTGPGRDAVAAARLGTVDVVPAPIRAEHALQSGSTQRQRSQLAPMVVLSVVGLVIVVALLFLFDYAGERTRDTVREIASPRKILQPGASSPPLQAADPVPQTTDPMPQTAGIVAAPAAVDAAAGEAAARAQPGSQQTGAVTAAATATASAAAGAAPDAADAAGAMPGAALPDPSPPSSTSTPAIMKQPDLLPAGATRPADDEATTAARAAASSGTVTAAEPAQAPRSDAPNADACRPELQALGLCGKVVR